jgi:ABC-type polysaccharide/polyol phosphate transport system ATPase subunit
MSKVDLQNVTLRYPLLGLRSRSLKHRIVRAATGGVIGEAAGVTYVEALRDITLRLRDGDRVGLIGHNGAGKSTLLKLLGQIFRPTAGTVSIEGRVMTTANMAVGMEAEATGIENIITRGLLLGMRLREIRDRIDEIAEFTELGDYLNMPLRIYSTGMLTRLAFATVTSMDADVLLMDEVIGTGDAAFMEKAEKRLKAFMNRSSILVLASHSDHVIRSLCNKAVLLNHGSLVQCGDVETVMQTYTAHPFECVS